MNGRRTGGSRLWPSGSNEIRWCNAGCPSLPACLERNPPACRQWPDAQPDAVWADSASGTWHSPMAIFPASHQRIRWLSAGGWGRKNWRVFGGPPMYAIWDTTRSHTRYKTTFWLCHKGTKTSQSIDLIKWPKWSQITVLLCCYNGACNSMALPLLKEDV